MNLSRRTLMSGAMLVPRLAAQEKPLRLAIAGLEHGHAQGFLRGMTNRADVELAGVWCPDSDLSHRYADRFQLPKTKFFTSLDEMLDQAKPQAVATFTSTFAHLEVVRACAKRRLPVMMEKPLAVTNQHAQEIAGLAKSSGIPVVVNYETTWYRSHAGLWQFIKENRQGGDIRKMVAMDGHQGPKEIGVGPEFFSWLTDPKLNGAGALFDFGCYGANLMTWLMDNQRPVAVTARVQRIKPQIYPKVDDEANIIVEYPKAVGLIEGSWNWPYSRKDLEVYTERSTAIATGGNSLRVRKPESKSEETVALTDLPPMERDPVSYLAAIARGELKPSGLSSLENNLIATEILVAARQSAESGKTVRL